MDRLNPLVIAGVAPHAPIIIPEVGGGESTKVRRTQEAMDTLAAAFWGAEIDTLVLISSHAPFFRDALAVRDRRALSGNLLNFRAPQVEIKVKVDLEMVAELGRIAEGQEFPLVLMDEKSESMYRLSPELDYGSTVPLYYLEKAGLNVPVVSIGISFLPLADLYNFGRIIRQAGVSLGRRIGLLASGDLSHRLTAEAPAGFAHEGAEFDRRVMDGLAQGDEKVFLGMPKALAERAGEDALRAIVMTFGALDGQPVRGEVLSYEGPFGVGYGVALLRPQEQEA